MCCQLLGLSLVLRLHTKLQIQISALAKLIVLTQDHQCQTILLVVCRFGMPAVDSDGVLQGQ